MSAGKGYNDLFIFYLNITFGLICFQTNGLSDYRAFGLLGFRTIGQSPLLCTYTGWIVPRELTSWGWWDEWDMTLTPRHRMRNSNPGGVRPSTLPLGRGGSPQFWLLRVNGEKNIFVSYKPPRPGNETRTLAWKAAVLTTTLGPPPI